MKGTIKSKKEIERLFREGRRFSLPLMSVLALPAALKNTEGRFAFIAGKKLGSAPLRNRCKRVMRHCVYENKDTVKGVDIVFIARRKLAKAPYAEVKRQTTTLLHKVKKRFEEVDEQEDGGDRRQSCALKERLGQVDG